MILGRYQGEKDPDGGSEWAMREGWGADAVGETALGEMMEPDGSSLG